MDQRAIDRIMGRRSPSPYERRIAERANHQFADSIGGCGANYREPKFGSTPTPTQVKTQKVR